VGRGWRPSGQFKGYVFAYFDSVENASVAKSSLLGLQVGNQVLDCKYSNKPAELAFQHAPILM
jgi:hypothetical protein